MSNEFHDTTFDCVGGSLVPAYGTGDNFACTVQGSQTGEAFVGGDAYLQAALGYSNGHLWRNVGIIIGLWIALVAVTAAGVERLRPQGAEKSYLLFQRTNDKDEVAAIAAGAIDEEKAGQPGSGGQGVQEASQKIKRTETVFTWKGLNYTVPVKGGHRQLLNQVQGYTKVRSLLAGSAAQAALADPLLLMSPCSLLARSPARSRH